MKDKKVTIRNVLKLHYRGVKELHSVNSKYFAVCTLYSVVNAITPYVAVFFSAKILKELALQQRPDVLWMWVAAGVACTGLCAILKAFLYQRNESLFDELYGRKELRRLYVERNERLNLEDSLASEFRKGEKYHRRSYLLLKCKRMLWKLIVILFTAAAIVGYLWIKHGGVV